MPDAPKKELSPEEKQQKRREKQLMAVVGPAIFITVAEGAALIQSRPQLARAIVKASGGKGAQTAQLLNTMQAQGAIAEFLLNPIIGRLSDRYGRKPFLLLCTALLSLSRLSVFLRPASRRAVQLDRVVSMALVTSFFSIIRAAQADRFSGKSLALAAAGVAKWAGLGLVVGPYLDTVFARVGGGAKWPFLGSAVLAASVCGLVATRYDESLEPGKRKPLDIDALVACNPFSFFKMLSSSRVVATLMVVSLLQTFGDGRNIQEVNAVFMQSHLGWSRIRISNMVASAGAALIVGSLFVKQQIKVLGIQGHTSFSNLCQVLGSALWGAAPAQAPWDFVLTHASLAASVGGQRKRDGVESTATKLCVAQGMGKGEVSAGLANWRSLASIIGPLVFGPTYAWATSDPKKRYMPGLPFYLVAALTVAAEGAFRTIDASNFRDEEGKRK